MATDNDGKCPSEDIRTWTAGWKQEIDFQEYTIPENYTMFYAFILASNYKKCNDNLTIQKTDNLRTPKFNAKFYEVYGKSDFLVKVFSKDSSFENVIDYYNTEVLPKKSNIVTQIDFYKVLETYTYNNNKRDFERKTDSEKKEFNIEQRNMINAFILLNEKTKKGSKNGYREAIKTSEMLTLFARKIPSYLLQAFIFRVYIMEDEHKHKRIMLYLNVDCSLLYRLNDLTTRIDDIVDYNGYEKTTLISTKKNHNIILPEPKKERSEKKQSEKSVGIMKKIFISYSSKDIDFKNELIKHLNLLQEFNITDNWSCEKITIGNWNDQIQKELDESDVIIYMLSANFFSSSYILEKEVQNVMNGKRDGKSILCIIVSDFIDLDKIDKYLQNWRISDKQKAILMLKDFQYLPYGKEYNSVTKQNERKIVSLKHFSNNSDIETALKQISEKVLEIL
jgi:hypothetical protein